MKVVLSEEGAEALDRLLVYMWTAEEKHYEECKQDFEPDDEAVTKHVFHDLVKLNEDVELNIEHHKKKQQEEHQRKLQEELEGEEEES